MSDVILKFTNNGPCHIKGTFRLETMGGTPIEVQGGEAWLCRCGGSAKKPFCDGTHKRIGFKSNLDQPEPT
ncbi:MAG TPA: CDGSH iron-sulfur domain-containing protein [bacterium]|nr:CDGSH iron-sulfur domain-containing protein [bacterium]